MGQALYRKYRSRNLDEIVGQEHITTTLQNALKSDRISHAYLFTGPRGVGKTSIARILAYEVNGLPYDDSGHHLDIIEIDAASNRRIDEIRELRDKVHVAPTSAKYKVYIIDEVHMLTKEAFNALLKTLEEPPQHAIFILATTEAHKLPETIISRTQRFSFKPVDDKRVAAHLKQIAQKENIDITDEALELLARHGEGSFRDSISLLDQVRSANQKVDAEVVRQAIGVPPESHLNKLAAALESGHAKQTVAELESMYDAGYQPAQIAKSLGSHFRKQLLAGNAASTEQTMRLLRELIAVPATAHPGAYLELVALEATSQNSQPAEQTSEPLAREQKPQVISTVPEAPTKPAIKQTRSQPSPTPDAQTPDMWSQALGVMKGNHNTLYGIARMAKPSMQDNKLVLAFAFPFHQKRCNEQRNRQLIQDVLLQTTGKTIEVNCIVDNNVKPPKIVGRPKAPKSATLESITSVFGGGEILDETR